MESSLEHDNPNPNPRPVELKTDSVFDFAKRHLILVGGKPVKWHPLGETIITM
jgi:hypothetical protein